MKLLYLCPKILWERRVSASRRHDVQAVSRHPDVHLQWSGPGWPDWDDDLGGVENVRRIMPDAGAVWAYKLDGTRVSGVKIPAVKDYRSVGKVYLLIEKVQEAWWVRPSHIPAWEQMVDRNVGLCVLSHPNDRPRLEEAEQRGVSVETILHCAEASIFGAAWRPWDERDIPVVLTGTIGRGHYPLRARWRDLTARLSSALGVPVIEHPRPPHLAGSLKEAKKYVTAYANILGRAKLVLGCSSRYRYNLARFPEVTAAGAVHVSDMPEGTPFGEGIVEVQRDASDDELIEAVLEAWNDQDSLRYRSGNARAIWELDYRQEHFADRFVEAVRSRL